MSTPSAPAKLPIVWVPMLRDSFAPLRESFDLREWGPDARPAAGDTIALEPQDLKLLTKMPYAILNKLRLSYIYDFN